jgi:predicted ATP-grasp superfamily ATP-dependent carboligase
VVPEYLLFHVHYRNRITIFYRSFPTGMGPDTVQGGAAIPAITTASSTAAIRSLGGSGVRTVAFSAAESPPGFASRHCEETIQVPDPVRDLEAYEAAVLDVARRPDVDTVLPFREADVYVLARNRGTLAAHVGTPWPSLETLRTVQDRRELFAIAREADVAAPRTRPLEAWSDPNCDVIVKPRYTVHAPEYADRFATPRTQWSTTRYVAPDEPLDRDALSEEMGHVPLVQEYVPTTDEYGFFAFCEDGEVVASFQHRQRRGWKYSGGPSAFRESVDIPALEAAGRRLLEALEFHGVAMVEFLRHPETGEFQLMEVNPRFWSSLPFTVQAGVDFPMLYWRQATGQPIEAPEYEVGVAGHLLRGEVLHLHSILAEEYPLVERPSLRRRTLEVARSLVRHPRFDYLSLRDPGPFVRDALNTVWGIDREAQQIAEGDPAPETDEPALDDPDGVTPVGAGTDD